MIAVLGATGIIGKSLGLLLAERVDQPLVLFTRNLEFDSRRYRSNVQMRQLSTFDPAEFKLIINAIGASDPRRVSELGDEIIDITQKWDRKIITGMRPDTRYVFLSSGIVHECNRTVDSPYIQAKLLTEANHRAFPDMSILDIRVFGYVDVSMPLGGGFLISQLASCIASGEPFQTSNNDFVRDYVGASELLSLIDCWNNAGGANVALDLYSLAPVSKAELLEVGRVRYGLSVFLDPNIASSPTGVKPAYMSQNFAASEIGYRPTRRAIDVVVEYLDFVASSSGRRAVGR